MNAPGSSPQEIPNSQADTQDFEFEALAQAANYRRCLVAEMSPFLKGDVLEIGAGIGQIMEELRRFPDIGTLTGLEPDTRFAAKFRERLPEIPLHACTTGEMPGPPSFDAIICINVLEHIRDDAGELARMRGLLRVRRGRLCMLVPARPEIYAPIDKDFGHWRRYTRRELEGKITAAGFEDADVRYYNFPGYFAWWLTFKMLKTRHFSPGSVRFYDKAVFPLANWLERSVLRPPIGQSLFAIARAAS